MLNVVVPGRVWRTWSRANKICKYCEGMSALALCTMAADMLSKCVDRCEHTEATTGVDPVCISCSGRLHTWCGITLRADEQGYACARICTACAKRKLCVKRSSNNINQHFGNVTRRTRLTMEQRLAIAKDLRAGASLENTMNKYNISRTTCFRAKADYHKLEKTIAKNSCFLQRKSCTGGYFPAIEESLIKFIEDAHRNGATVTRSALRAHALTTRDALVQSDNITDNDKRVLKHFLCSGTWLSKFVTRNGKTIKTIKETVNT